MMRTLLLISCLLQSAALAVAQKAPIVSSASDWAVLVITPTDTVTRAGGSALTAATKGRSPRTKLQSSTTSVNRAAQTTEEVEPERTSVARTPAGRSGSSAKAATKAFLETFVDNHNGWLTGRRNGFELEIADDNSYYMRSQRTVGTGQSLPRPGRSYIKLPETLNLNRADTFTVSVEMIVPPGVSPDAGLLIGVKDTSNYCQFRLLDKNKVALYTRINGMSQPNYMTGNPTFAKVAIDSKRNTLTIRRTGEQLHFYINGREVEDSPHPYRPFKGNGVGFISYANAVKFQYLTVQVGR